MGRMDRILLGHLVLYNNTRDVLIIFKRVRSSCLMHSFRISIGNGSNGPDFVGASNII